MAMDMTMVEIWIASIMLRPQMPQRFFSNAPRTRPGTSGLLPDRA